MNAHNEQHDSASPVVKQNLTTQPAAAQEAVAWPNECSRTVPEALRFLANHERPSGGEDNFNSLHLIQLASEIERMASKPLYAAPVTAAPAVDVETLRALSDRWANDRSYTGSPVDDIRALIEQPTKTTPAAPGIDLKAFREPVAFWFEHLVTHPYTETNAARLREAKRLLALIDASPKGDDVADTLRLLLDERNHRTDGDLRTLAARCLHLSRGDRDLIAMRGALIEKLQQRIAKDSPKGGSEARDAVLAELVEAISAFKGKRGAFMALGAQDERTVRLWWALANAQAGDAEVQP